MHACIECLSGAAVLALKPECVQGLDWGKLDLRRGLPRTTHFGFTRQGPWAKGP